MLVDSHCHIDLIVEQNLEVSADLVIKRAWENEVKYILNVCTRLASFPRIIALVEQYEHLAASLGVHPNEDEEIVDVKTLVTLAKHPKVIAIGETGLDYFRSTGDLDWQRERFICHITAAKQLAKPLIIHTRQAKEDTIAIMQAEQASIASGVMHCFSEDVVTAKKALDMGFYISFSGVVTFKNATQLHEVAKYVPLDRMLVETDAPYLAPVPHRGKKNEPSFVKHTAEFIAQLRGISYQSVAEQTTKNFFALFKGATQPHV